MKKKSQKNELINADLIKVRRKFPIIQIFTTLLAVGFCKEALPQEKPVCSMISEEMIFTRAPFQQCHASTLVGLDKGNLMAAWFGGSYEGAKDVCIWASIQQNKKWSPPYKIVCGEISDTLRYACWNPVLFRAGKKRLILYYKTGPSPREWWGMSVISSDNGKTWSNPKPLDNILGPVRNKPVILASGTWLNPSSKETMDRWQVFVERSTNQGLTWESMPIDTGNRAKVIQPALLVNSRGEIQALCRSDQDFIMESWSCDDGKSWSPLKKTKIPNPNSGIDAITLRSGLKILVFNPMPGGKDWVNGRNLLSVAISKDGAVWTDVMDLENKPAGEFSYPAIIQTSDGLVHISYTYNRATIKHVVLKFNSENPHPEL